MKEVELTVDNVTKCVCPVCPVQASSECIGEKRPGWERARTAVGDILAQYPAYPEAFDMDYRDLETTEVGKRNGFKKPERKNMIELYCSKAAGRSSCADLDGAKPCQCPTCAVCTSHQLDSTYYCMSEHE